MEEVEDVAVSSGTRALRRHHLARIKANRKNYWGFYRGDRGTHMSERQLGVVAHTPAVCSCWMCCNPRRSDGERTMQERRAMQPELQDCTAEE